MGPVLSSGDEQQPHIQVRLTSSEICVTRVGDGYVFDKQRTIMIRVGLRGRGHDGRRVGNYRVTARLAGNVQSREGRVG